MARQAKKKLTTADISFPIAPASPPQHPMFPSYCTICDVLLDNKSYSSLYCSPGCQGQDSARHHLSHHHHHNQPAPFYSKHAAISAVTSRKDLVHPPSAVSPPYSTNRNSLTDPTDYFSLDDISTFPMEMAESPPSPGKLVSPVSSARNSMVSFTESSSRASVYSVSTASAFTPSLKSTTTRASLSRRYSNIAHYYNRPPSSNFSPSDVQEDLHIPELEGTSIGDKPIGEHLSREDDSPDHSPATSYKSQNRGLGLAEWNPQQPPILDCTAVNADSRPRPRRQSLYIRSSQHLYSSVGGSNNNSNNSSVFSLSTSPMNIVDSPRSISLVLPRPDLVTEHIASLEYEFPKCSH